jgi:hypothetical protein
MRSMAASSAAANRMRVNVRLVGVQSGNHLWERFEEPVTDLFEMQDGVVARIANTLDTELYADEARRAERSPSPDPANVDALAKLAPRHGCNESLCRR